jgi:hypothetical protein
MALQLYSSNLLSHTVEQFVPTFLPSGGSKRYFKIGNGDHPVSAPADKGTGDPKIIPLPSSGSRTFQRALATLRKLRSLSKGWDGYRAAPADPGSFEDAEKFLGCISNGSFNVSANIHAEGHAVIELERYSIKAHFRFLGDGKIAAIIDLPNDEWDDDLHGFDGATLPRVVAERLGLRG